jgi:hypothetical protein
MVRLVFWAGIRPFQIGRSKFGYGMLTFENFVSNFEPHPLRVDIHALEAPVEPKPCEE